jgi:cell division transport system permease protein
MKLIIKQWLNHHSQPFQLVLGRMRQNLLASILMCCVIGVTLSLPAILFTVVDNLSRFAGNVESKPQLSLFLKLDASSTEKSALTEQLKSIQASLNLSSLAKKVLGTNCNKMPAPRILPTV